MTQQRIVDPSVTESVVDRFERYWRTGSAPNVADFLESQESLSGQRQALLVELIAIDLEYRWRNASERETTTASDLTASVDAWLLETYVEQWPELGSREEIPLELIAEEYRVRQRWGDQPNRDEYRRRFPNRGGSLMERLEAVDVDLRHEARALTDTDEPRVTVGRKKVTRQFEEDYHQAEQHRFQPRIFGRYHLLRVLGRGAMGVVYLAEDQDLHRKVALKTPRLENASEERIARFLNEARSAAALNHPNLCPIYDVGQIDEHHYITMAYVEGQTLAEQLRSQGRFSVTAAIALATKIARAMQAAHDAGVIHRDLKLSNIMIDGRGEPMIMDFGLARRIQVDEPRLTHSGQAVGSPAYMAPEQVEGRSADICPPTDVYALGVILYELLTGQLPFRGGTAEVLAQILRDAPSPLTTLDESIPTELDALCTRMLAKKPQDRPASMQQVALELSALNKQLWDETETQPITPPPVQKVSRRRWLPVSVAFACLPLFVIFALSIAPLVFRVQTDKGDVVIKSFSPDIAVTVKRNGQRVKQFNFEKGPVSTKLQTGDIEIEISGGKPDGVRIQNGKFQLTKGKTVVVEILGPEVAENKKAEIRAQSLFDSLRREDIPIHKLKAAGRGDPARAPAELVAVLGDSRLMHQIPSANDVAFQPGGRVLASAGNDGALRFWDLDDGSQIDSISVVRNRLLSVAFSPRGDRIAAGGGYGFLTIWDTQTKQKVLAVPNLSGHVSAVDWAPDGTRLFGIIQGNQSADKLSRIRAWDTTTGREVFALKEGYPGPNVRFALSPDGKRLATSFTPAKGPPQVKVWDAQSGKHLFDLTHGQSQGIVYDLSWSPDGKRLASSKGNEGRAILLWNVEDRKPARIITIQNRSIAASAWSPDGKWFAVSENNEVVLWDTGKWKPIRTFTCQREGAGYYVAVAFSHDGKYLAGAGHLGVVALWDLGSGKEIVSPEGHTSAISGVSVSRDGRWAATSSFDRTVRLWQSATGRQAAVLEAGPGRLYDVTFSPDGTKLAAASLAPNYLTVWDTTSRQKQYVLPASQGRAVSIAWSQDGKKLALGCDWPEMVKVVAATSGQELYHIETAKGISPCVSFSPDGRLLAVGGKNVVIHDAVTGKVIRTAEFAFHVRSVQFSPDGRHLLVAGDNPNTAVIDAKSGKMVRQLLTAGEHKVLGAINNDDGTRIATINSNRQLIVWDTSTAESLCRVQLSVEVQLPTYNPLAFAPDGRHVLVANSDGTVYVIRVERSRR